MPIVVSLSMSKAGQQNLILNLHEAFGKEIRFGLVKACGLVGPENPELNPTNIANRAVALYEQNGEEREIMTSIVDP